MEWKRGDWIQVHVTAAGIHSNPVFPLSTNLPELELLHFTERSAYCSHCSCFRVKGGKKSPINHLQRREVSHECDGDVICEPQVRDLRDITLQASRKRHL